MLTTGARMGGGEISGGSCGCGGDNGADEVDNGGSNGKSDGDGDHRRLMGAMVKVLSDKFRQI